jgi:membrane protein implicated in regulation of membrane protease activity
MLEQMERALYAEDPKFASALEGGGLRTFTHRRVYLAGAGFLVGIGLLMGGMVAQQPWVSVVGFLVMLVCAVLGVTAWRRGVRPSERPAQTGPGRRRLTGRHQPRRGKVMDRIEERWQRRRDEQGQ